MKKGWLALITLLIFTLLTRLPYLINQSVAFDFDHGRDALATLHMIKTGSLRFIGPWTSIPGLFFGPAWYYWLALVNIFSTHPVAPAFSMLFLGLVQIFIAWRWFGFWEALMVVSAPAWMTLSTSASNAFPMTLITWLILIWLKITENKKLITLKQLVFLGTIIGLGFHFSSALAIFYLPIVLAIFWIRKIKSNLKMVLAWLGGFLLPWLPQMLFELKHQFLELKAVIAYFSQGIPRTFKLTTIHYYAKAVFHELGLAVLPFGNELMKNLGLSLLILGSVWLLVKKTRLKNFGEWLIFILIPILGFSFIHFNVWYVYGLLPIAVVAIGKILRHSPKIIKFSYALLLITTPIFGLNRYYREEKEIIANGRVFLPAKIQAIDYIYQQAGGKSFASYHYVPEIYDYAYQYLYFWQGLKSKPLPTEFSYQPGEISYVPEKPDLLSLFPSVNGKPEKVFLVLNLPENQYHYPLQAWINQFAIDTILSQKEISPEIWVWEVQLKNDD